MFRFVLKRLAYMVVTLWVVITLTFVMMHSVPGNPFNSQRMTPTVLANLNAKYGLDRPLYEQYVVYFRNLLKGDLGISMRNTNRTVNELIVNHFPVSAKLGFWAMLWALPTGIGLGVLSAVKRNKWQDRTVQFLAVFFTTVPWFVTAVLLQMLFGVMWKKWTGDVLLPVGGWGEIRHMILPIFIMGTGLLGGYMRMMRSSMLDVLGQDYTKTARAKGLSGTELLWRHTLRNASLPIVTMLGPTVVGMITGTLVLEQIFGIPGLGRYFVISITNSDYTLILGTTVFLATLTLVALFLVDVAYGIVDPRIRLHKSHA